MRRRRADRCRVSKMVRNMSTKLYYKDLPSYKYELDYTSPCPFRLYKKVRGKKGKEFIVAFPSLCDFVLWLGTALPGVAIVDGKLVRAYKKGEKS